MKHTPGPWRWANYHNTRTQVPDKRIKVVIGSNEQGFCHTVGMDAESDTANAQLIAAAPDLLEAAELLIKNLPDGEYVGLGHLRMAIHKAKGIA